MKLFKTRDEVKRLQRDVAELRAMLVAHFGIKYTLEDFREWADRHPKSKSVPVKEGEWYHYGEMLELGGAKLTGSPNNTQLRYRSKKVVIDD